LPWSPQAFFENQNFLTKKNNRQNLENRSRVG
jgi:hypothetical protein